MNDREQKLIQKQNNLFVLVAKLPNEAKHTFLTGALTSDPASVIGKHFSLPGKIPKNMSSES